MRLTKAMIEELVEKQTSFLYSHHNYRMLVEAQKEAVYQGVLALDPVANNLIAVIYSVPKLVRDQLPKVGNTRVGMYPSDYDQLRKESDSLGLQKLPEHCPVQSYAQNYEFPEGKVLHGSECGTLRGFKRDSEVSVRVWHSVLWAISRVLAAEKQITKAAEHLQQLCLEMGTVEQLQQTVRCVDHLLPASWFAETPEKPAPSSVLDPETAARLRALILGEGK